MTDDTEDSSAETTKLSMTIQRGAGVDRRGDVTVELVRERPPRLHRTTREVSFPPDHPVGGETIATTADDATFAEFVLETERAERLLRDRLGLDATEDTAEE